MSLSTPILTISPEIWAEAVDATIIAARLKIALNFIGFFLRSFRHQASYRHPRENGVQDQREHPRHLDSRFRENDELIAMFAAHLSHPEIVVELAGVPRNVSCEPWLKTLMLFTTT